MYMDMKKRGVWFDMTCLKNILMSDIFFPLTRQKKIKKNAVNFGYLPYIEQ